MHCGLFIASAGRDELSRLFPLLAELQPVRWQDDGLVLFPALAPDARRVAWAREQLPVPLTPLAEGLGWWPDPPAAWVAGIYRRSEGHAPGPPGITQIVQTPGDGFGPGDHHTTMMCLRWIRQMAPGLALDVGCGSGLLSLAWAALDKGLVHAIDIDPRATRQTEASAAASGTSHLVRTQCTRVEAVDCDADVLLANVPAPVHHQITDALQGKSIRQAVISGLRTGESRPVLAAYGRLGLRRIGAAGRGRWQSHLLAAGAAR